MIMISGYLKVDPAEVHAFIADIRAGLARTHKEDGCIFYDFAITDASTGTVLVAERWRDQEALNAHVATPESRAWYAKWRSRMTDDVKMFEVTKELGLDKSADIISQKLR